ncbi:hypothetical protein BKA64DRAFT_776521 [Cadophora sp. MPI-SDFR-AT-0126]|nr:hypothetical protein BKA64DRAFT_776521 [Leotiomycetes sp. MPI-SDFR-AT-0126]
MGDNMTPVARVPRMVTRPPNTYRAPTVDDDDTEDDESVVPDTTPHTNTPVYPRHQSTPKSKFRHSRISPTQRQAFDPLTNMPNMSSQTRIQFQASDVLRQLEPLPSGPFGPEHQLVIARNMALIQGVTADSREERMEAERMGREIVRGVERVVRVREPGVLEVNSEVETEDDGMWTPSGSGVGSGSPPEASGNRPGSRKRRRSDEDDRKNTKKARLYANPSLQIQPPIDITKLAPLPLRITYPPHPTTDRPDTWFIHNFQQLYRQISAFCTTYYGLHDIPLTDEPWEKCKVTPEFLKWAEMVAEPEPRMGCWDELLRDRRLRKWFVMAVLVRVLRVKVFEELLFGGTREQVLLMHQVDRAFLGREGFQRDSLRASQARTILGASPVTQLFYPSVAKLTAQLFLLLAPLTSYLYSLPPPPNTPAPQFTALYQSLHNLVSQAGYMAICVKLTPSIIQMYDVRPGDTWEPDDMHCLDEAEAFVGSKEVVVGDYRQLRHNIKVAKEEAEVYMRSLAPSQPPDSKNGQDGDEEDEQHEVEEQDKDVRGSWKYRRAKAHFDKMDALYTDKLSNPPSRTHRALIKLSVWPVIRRYTPGSAADDSQPTKPLHEKDGFRIFLIAKAGVVAYYGRENTGGRGEEEGYVRLGEWIEIKERQREERDWRGVVERGARNAVRASSVVVAVVATGLVGRVVDRVMGAGVADGFGGWMEGAVEGVMRNVKICFMGGVCVQA